MLGMDVKHKKPGPQLSAGHQAYFMVNSRHMRMSLQSGSYCLGFVFGFLLF